MEMKGDVMVILPCDIDAMCSVNCVCCLRMCECEKMLCNMSYSGSSLLH